MEASEVFEKVKGLFIDDLGINLKSAKDLGIHTYKAANEDKVEEFLDRFLSPIQSHYCKLCT